MVTEDQQAVSPLGVPAIERPSVRSATQTVLTLESRTDGALRWQVIAEPGNCTASQVSCVRPRSIGSWTPAFTSHRFRAPGFRWPQGPGSAHRTSVTNGQGYGTCHCGHPEGAGHDIHTSMNEIGTRDSRPSRRAHQSPIARPNRPVARHSL